MAQKSTMHPPKGGNIKKGICENHQYLNPDTGETGDCPKCASGEIQSVNVQRLSDFHCSVCGAKLVPVKESFMKKNGKLLISILVALCLGGGIWALSSLSGCSKDKTEQTDDDGPETPPEEGPETPDGEDGGVGPEDGGKTGEGPTGDGGTGVPEPPKTVLGGAAKLVHESGYTHIVFLRDYSLDLGKSDGTKLQIRKGERIEHADIRNNVLRGGDYINLDKEENSLGALNVKL